MKNIIIKQINKYFNYVKIATLSEVQKKLNANITKTVHRYLKKLDFFTSYSHKGKYYSHKRYANFDENGLWSYKKIHFSIHGKLTDTIVNLIITSQSGYNSNELRKLLHVEVNNTLLKLEKNKKIIREKINCKFYYFSGNFAIKKRQFLLQRSIIDEKFSKKLTSKNMEDFKINRGIALLFNQLDEKTRRLYAGLESAKLGFGGDKIISETLGIDPHTVSKGRREILTGDFEKTRIRKTGAGRKSIKKKHK